MKILEIAVRQYRHNNSDGLVMGYDVVETEKVVKALQEQVKELKSALKRLGEDEANFINAAKYFATRGDYLEADHRERIKYAKTEQARIKAMNDKPTNLLPPDRDPAYAMDED